MRRLLLILLSLIPLVAQAQDDYGLYMDEAGEASLIWRGRIDVGYDFLFNGTPYWESPDFRSGMIRYNGRDYFDVQINIDAYANQVLVRPQSRHQAMLLNRDEVEYFIIGDRKFVYPRRTYGQAIPEGFYEVLFDGRAKLLMQVTKTLREDPEGRRRSEAGYDGQYHYGIANIFIREVRYYYVSASGEVKQLRRRGDILKCYKDRKKEIRKYVSALEKGQYFNIEQYALRVLRYVEGAE